MRTAKAWLGRANGANHDEHWHAPYFEPSKFADDLEKVAEPMLEWLERAFALMHEPDLFRDSLAEIGAGILSYPDWMQPLEVGCMLGPLATTCVLRWTWLGSADTGSPGASFADSLHSTENQFAHVALDFGTCVGFFSGLPEAVARDILVRLGDEKYAAEVATVGSIWHRIRHDCEQRFDPAAYLRTCAAHLAAEWRYGEPLIADALARGDLAEAEKLVESTLCILLRVSPDAPWRPELGLLPGAHHYHGPEQEAAISRLLGQWEATATQRGQTARAAVCRLHRALYEHPHDWVVVLAAWAVFGCQAGDPVVGERLLAQWRERTVAACSGLAELNRQPEESWVHWLIEARREPALPQAVFREPVLTWLGRLLEDAGFFGRNWHSLALFTRALAPMTSAQARFPTFQAKVLAPVIRVAPGLLVSLEEALAYQGDAAAPLDPLPIWRKHLHTLVPSPGSTGGSHYRESAWWMKALSEVNRSSYDNLLAHWKIEFKRRRNLWAEMAAAHCPGI